MSSNGSKMRIVDLLKKKRDGHELTKEEITFFIESVCDSSNNSIQESQIGYNLGQIIL